MSEVAATDDRRWWSKALLVGAVVGLVALPIGALGSKFGIWPFTAGFLLLAVGVVLCTIVFFLGILAAIYAHRRRWPSDRKSALIGVALSVVVLGLMANQFLLAGSVPQIHNISTDTQNPPQFVALVPVREAEGANPLAYDAEQLADVQRQAYPWVKSLISSQSKAIMVNRVEQVLKDMGMEVVSTDVDAGRIEATDETFWFGFKDDVVVRVRSEGAGSVLDIRSVSRVGQSDLGKNAARIGEILNALSEQA